MNKKVMLFVVLLLLSVFALTDSPRLLVRAARTWVVDKSGQGDFPSIQQAIDAADDGDTVEVLSGVFFEHLVVNKAVTLTGENSSATVIDGNGTGTVINVATNSVDISGFTVQKSGDFQQGVFVNQSSNCTIRENIIIGNYYGIWLGSSEKNTITDNLIRGNVWGIYLQGSSSNSIEYNDISDSYVRGFTFDSSDNNIARQNMLGNNVEGLYLESSSGNLLRNNSLITNSYPLGVHGSELAHFIHDVDTSNRIDDEPVYYWVNQSHMQVPPDAGYVAVVNSTDITVKELNLTSQQEGLLFAYTDNSTIEDLHISNARCGLLLVSCRDLNITGNNFTHNNEGVRLEYSVNNTFRGNTISGNIEGIFLDHSKSNTITENTVANDSTGVFVYYSAYNLVYHNNFVSNELQVYVGLAKILVTNAWDWSGEGNYWSDYTGKDSHENGIGGVPYVLDRNNQDNYPLMGLLSVFSEGSQESPEPLLVVSNSSISDFECDLVDKVIRFKVAGPSETLGFCRLTAPRALLNDSYEVLVDGLPPLTFRELASNSTHVFLYFTYEHSAQIVIIVPEYSLTLLIFALISLTTVLACRTELRGVKESRKQSDRTELLKR